MSFIDYNHRIKPNKVSLTLSRLDDEQTFARLTDAYNINAVFRLDGELSELNFTLPYDKTVRHVLVKNQNAEKIKENYLVRFKYMHFDEVFIITNISDNMAEDGDSKQVQALLLPHELSGQMINSFRQDGLNCRQVLSGGAPKRDEEGNILIDDDGKEVDVGGILLNTNWMVGEIDAEFETSTRSYDWDGITALEALFQLADTYDALVTFDTKQRKINVVKPDSVGKNQKFTVGYGKYAKSMSQSNEMSDVTTRLKATGKDGLTFSTINPSGLDSIDDYSFFLYPFERDINTKKTIKSSYHMPDDLCHAIYDYQELVESKSGELNKLFDELNDRQKEIDNRSYELSNLEIAYTTIEDKLEVAKAQNKDLTDLNLEEAAKKREVDDKKAQITDLENLQTEVRKKIAAFQDEIAVENNFTSQQLYVLNKFTRVRTFTDDKCVTPEDLLEQTKKQMDKVKYPQLTVNVDIVDIFSIMEEYRNWSRLQLGDTIKIKYEKIGINVLARITEMSFDFENQTITLTISNVKRAETAEKKVMDKLQQSYSGATSFTSNKSKYDKIEKTANQLNDYMNGELDATKQRIIAGVNNSVTIDRKGIRITNPDYPNDVVILQAGVTAISRDGGNNWQTAITAEGIVGERIFGKIIAGNNLTIDASDKDGNKTFTVDSKGVWLNGMALFITGENDENLIERWNKAIAQGEVYNGVKIDIVEGLTVTRSDGKVKTVLNATEGISISHYDASSEGDWTKKFYVDTDGKLITKDIIAERLIMTGNDGKPIIDATTGTINFDKFVNQVGTISPNNIDVTNIRVNDSNFTGTLSATKLNLSENLKNTVVKDDNGNTAFSIDSNAKVSIPSLSNTTLKGTTKVQDTLDLSSSTIKLGNKRCGVNVSVTANAATFSVAGLSETDSSYGVSITPAWNTNYWVTNKTATSFVVNFGTPPSSAATFDWNIYRV